MGCYWGALQTGPAHQLLGEERSTAQVNSLQSRGCVGQPQRQTCCCVHVTTRLAGVKFDDLRNEVDMTCQFLSEFSKVKCSEFRGYFISNL